MKVTVINLILKKITLTGNSLNVAYNGVVNPLFHTNPEAVDLMPTASSPKSAYSRAQVANLPPIPLDAIDIAIPPEYANIQIGNATDVVPFLMFNFSYASVVGDKRDSTILAFGTDALFTELCNARTVYMDRTGRSAYVHPNSTKCFQFIFSLTKAEGKCQLSTAS